MLRAIMPIAITASLCLLFGACKPTYPKCAKDAHCRDGEFCVNQQCQQCRQSADCEKGKECKEGRCEPLAGYCETLDDCPNGGACKDNRCVPCKADDECGDGVRCRDGRCLKPGQCASDDDCPDNSECQNGTCVAPPATNNAAAGCQPEAVFFDFNEFVLTSAATAKLQAAAKCIKSVTGRTIRVEGHCDPRGTEEYNLALGDRRARSVQRYIERLGVPTTRMRPVSKGKLEATGTGPTSWGQDRKVLFIWE